MDEGEADEGEDVSSMADIIGLLLNSSQQSKLCSKSMEGREKERKIKQKEEGREALYNAEAMKMASF